MERSRHSVGYRIALFSGLLAIGSAAQASNSLLTAASAEIRDSAGVTVLDNAPLRLLLKGGVPTAFMFTVVPAQSGSPASATLGIASVPIDINGSGLVAGVTDTGEILSVSVAAGQIAAPQQADGTSGPNVTTVIAQFN